MIFEAVINPEHLYQALLNKLVLRADEVKRFEIFLRTHTSWLTSPASTRFHLACTGGLLQHSLNVAHTLLALRKELAPGLSEESCVIAVLYHDVGKVGSAEKPYYLPNANAWEVRNRGILYSISTYLVHLDLPTRSLFLVSSYIHLTEEEAQAIRYHGGQYIEEYRSVAHREEKLTRLLQYADNWSGSVLEKSHC